MRHVLRRHPERSGLHWLEPRRVKPPSHTQRPTPFYNGNALVDRMHVRQRDISRILVNPEYKGLSRLGGIPPHILDPLSRLHRVEGNDDMMTNVLCLHIIHTD